MILLADSGSTKTDWCVVEQGRVLKTIQTKGINPFFQTEEEIAAELASVLVPQLPGTHFEQVCFYGAGCAFDKVERVRRAIRGSLMVDSEPEVCSDMLAAARALCGTEPGIACILGTGSNSCFYDGCTIQKNVSPLGFILGDEGSGACLGKRLVADILKNQMPPSLQQSFMEQYQLSAADIIDRVYRKPFPNRFLASLSPFLAQHLDEPAVRRLVSESFADFFRRNVHQYDYHRYDVHFVGSVAYYYQNLLREVAEQNGVRVGRILKSPMEGLLAYHAG